MSDGCTDSSDAYSARQTLNSIKNVVIHTVAFGSADASTLRTMASSSAHFHAAANGAALVRSFMDIAKEISGGDVSDQLYQDVAKKIAEALQTKLIQECL